MNDERLDIITYGNSEGILMLHVSPFLLFEIHGAAKHSI